MLMFPIEIRSEFGALKAARLADEQRLEIGEPDVIGPLIGGDFDVVAALVIRAIN